MVLEVLLSARTARMHPGSIFFFTLILCSVCLFAAHYLFPQASSILALAFVTMGMMPIIHSVIVIEEELEIEKPGWAPAFIARHFDLIKIYSWFFLGIIACYAFWYVMLPPALPLSCMGNGPKELGCLIPTRATIFSEQKKIFSAITGLTTVGEYECKNPAARSFEKCATFIFNNNWGVMLIAVAFSFLYGAGAIFLIGWNASIIGFFIGKEIIEVHWLAGLLKIVGYLPHGIWEISGYFVGAIAGGIISAAISRKKYRTHDFEIIAKDVLALIIIATIVLVVGALIEAWLITCI